MDQDTVITVTTEQATEDYQDAARLERELLEAGYRRGWPQWVTLPCRKMDARIIRQSRCNCCDTRGQECHPFRRTNPRSYVLLCVCPSCGNGATA